MDAQSPFPTRRFYAHLSEVRGSEPLEHRGGAAGMESTAVERISKIKLFRGSPFPEVADGGQVRYRSGDAASLKYLRSRERHENRGGEIVGSNRGIEPSLQQRDVSMRT